MANAIRRLRPKRMAASLPATLAAVQPPQEWHLVLAPRSRTADFERAFQLWIDKGLPPVPDHSRLAHYIARRDIHCMKLCMIASTAARAEGSE